MDPLERSYGVWLKDSRGRKNSKHEFRNPKQTQNPNTKMFETENQGTSKHGMSDGSRIFFVM